MGLEQRLDPKGTSEMGAVEGASTQVANGSTKKSYRILVVDDNPSDRFFIKRAINAHYGCDNRAIFPEAEDGQSALNVLENLPADETIDMISTDFDMPGMGSIEFLERLRGDARYARHSTVRVVVNSGTERNSKEKEDLLKYGVLEEDILRKPDKHYDATSFASVLDKYCPK